MTKALTASELNSFYHCLELVQRYGLQNIADIISIALTSQGELRYDREHDLSLVLVLPQGLVIDPIIECLRKMKAMIHFREDNTTMIRLTRQPSNGSAVVLLSPAVSALVAEEQQDQEHKKKKTAATGAARVAEPSSSASSSSSSALPKADSGSSSSNNNHSPTMETVMTPSRKRGRPSLKEPPLTGAPKTPKTPKTSKAPKTPKAPKRGIPPGHHDTQEDVMIDEESVIVVYCNDSYKKGLLPLRRLLGESRKGAH